MATQHKGNKGVVATVLDRLNSKARPERTKRTLVLTKASYERFEELCRKEGKYPSDVIDEFISLFVEERG